MALPEQRFTGITPERFEALKEKVQDTIGVAIESNQGRAGKNGFSVQWSYDPAAQVLVIQVLSKPWFVSAGTVTGKIWQMAMT